MQAIQISADRWPGGAGISRDRRSRAGSGEVAIQVGAAGVNFIDIYHRQGVYPMPLPFVPGREGAGRVIAVGAGVDGVAVGDRVAWLQVPGSYAEVGGRTGRQARSRCPDDVSDEQAAALALQGLTAQSLATDVYRIEPGDTVLIHAGAGGVGLLLTQIAKIKGARVITTVSTQEKAVLSRAAGADEVLVGYDGLPRPRSGISPTAVGVDGGLRRGRQGDLRRFPGLARGVRGHDGAVRRGERSGAAVRHPAAQPGGSLKLTRPNVDHFVAGPGKSCSAGRRTCSAGSPTAR